MNTHRKSDSAYVSANKTSIGVDFPRFPLKVNMLAEMFNSFNTDSSKSYKLTSQKKTLGFVMLIIDLSSDFPNDGSSALTGHPKYIEANKIGAKSGPLLAKKPHTLFAGMCVFSRF